MEKHFLEMNEKAVLESGITIPYNTIAMRLQNILTIFRDKEWFTAEQVSERFKIPLHQITELLNGFTPIFFTGFRKSEKAGWQYKVAFDFKRPSAE